MTKSYGGYGNGRYTNRRTGYYGSKNKSKVSRRNGRKYRRYSKPYVSKLVRKRQSSKCYIRADNIRESPGVRDMGSQIGEVPTPTMSPLHSEHIPKTDIADKVKSKKIFVR